LILKFNPTSIPGVVLIDPDVHQDARGFFLESYQKEKFRAGGINAEFVQDNHSQSLKGILRGLHIQLEQIQAKLVRVTKGEIFDVLVDCRRGSPAFRKWEGFYLSADNFKQVYVPPGLLHGFCVMSDVAEVEYKCSNYYHPQSEITVMWNDPNLGIEWPIPNPVLSKKDQNGFKLNDVIGRFPVFKE